MDLNPAFSFEGSLWSKEHHKQDHFSPYENNHGTVAAITGDDFAIIASDTRLSTGYSIYSRQQPKLFKLSEKTVIGIAGCWCDTIAFMKILKTRFKMYQHEYNKEMSTKAVSQLVTSLLYYKRFFPYYVHCVVAGIDQDGKGHCYGYDSIGHKGKGNYVASGSANSLMNPLMDNQIGLKNMVNAKKEPLTLEKGISLMKDLFISAAERDIYTGDSVVLNIMSKDGFTTQKHDLRKD